MKFSTQVAKKLSAYSLFAGAFLAAEKSQAQIIYTDVMPDDTIYAGDQQFFPLDLNGDGIVDFQANVEQGLSSRSVLFYGTSTGYQSVWFKGGWAYPFQLENNESICPADVWAPIDYQVNAVLLFVTSNGQQDGHWQGGVTDGFIGLRIHPHGGTHQLFGWARLDVAADASYIILKDYACNLTVDECIMAGEGIPIGCVDNYEPNNSSSQASLISVNQKINALIDVPGDHDWFQFTPPADKNNIRIVLRKLPANYNIKLLDQNLNVLDISKHSGKINDTIAYNNLDPSQNYYVVVKGQNVNAYNANECYTLKVEASSDPYKMIEPTATVEEDDLQIFPTPAANQLSISGVGGEWQLSVFDLSGRKMFTQKFSDEESSVNVSSLTNGMYLLQLKNENEIVVKKFEVKR